jgi:hypothetical protein
LRWFGFFDHTRPGKISRFVPIPHNISHLFRSLIRPTLGFRIIARANLIAVTAAHAAVNDYEWFDVTLDETGEPVLVVHSRKVWRGPPGSPPVSERVRRAIEQANLALARLRVRPTSRVECPYIADRLGSSLRLNWHDDGGEQSPHSEPDRCRANDDGMG